VDAERTRAALAVLRTVFGDVGIIAETPMPGEDGLASARLVLITDTGPRTVIVTSPDQDHHDAWVRLRDASGADVLGVCDEPSLLIRADRT
jgi:hypothetical protein